MDGELSRIRHGERMSILAWTCRIGIHRYEWLVGNRLRCTRCGKIVEDLP
jgi:hypothetical protein